jgi:hypothetical protein
MSYKYHPECVIGIRKVNWDQLWHVLYDLGRGETWDRVTMEEALAVEASGLCRLGKPKKKLVGKLIKS